MNIPDFSFLEEDTNLKPYHTFAVDCTARYFASVNTYSQLTRLLTHLPYPDRDRLILGGGSNMLFLGDYDGLIIHNDFKGIEKIEEQGNRVVIRAGAGVNWHHFVSTCVKNEWGGIENLALIPGTVGAAPVQNIGAYGVELDEVFVSLEAFNLETHEVEKFEKEKCEFAYRDSIFKRRYRNKYLITEITVQLRKNATPNTSYQSLSEYLQKQNISNPSIEEVFQAVVDIRNSKLPNPSDLGNAGSFFKNPIVKKSRYRSLREQFPDIPGYEISDDQVKVPAAWLIDQAGWRGTRRGEVGTYPHQALVIVNYGEATGPQILEFAADIRQSVYHKFNIKLSPEVNIITSGDQDWRHLLTG